MPRIRYAAVLNRMPPALRWLLVPPTTIAVWLATVFALGLGSMLVHGLLPADAIDRMVEIEYRHGFVGALAAFAWVVSGSIMAPSRRRWASLALFGLGAWAAHALLWNWYNPGDDASNPSHVPFYLTLLGGIAGVTAICLASHRSRVPPLIHTSVETEAR